MQTAGGRGRGVRLQEVTNGKSKSELRLRCPFLRFLLSDRNQFAHLPNFSPRGCFLAGSAGRRPCLQCKREGGNVSCRGAPRLTRKVQIRS